MKSSLAKATLLHNIRVALSEPVGPPVNMKEEITMFPPMKDDALVHFAESLTKAGGYFVYCESVAEFAEQLLSLTEKRKWNNLFCWELDIQQVLDQIEFPYFNTREKFVRNVQVGITTCEALVARQGSVVVSSESPSGRKMSIYPEIHLVVAFTSQLVPEIHDAIALLQHKYANHLPSSVSFITGPSRTADIEKTLVIGAHGPKELYVFVIDEA